MLDGSSMSILGKGKKGGKKGGKQDAQDEEFVQASFLTVSDQDDDDAPKPAPSSGSIHAAYSLY